MEFVYKKVKHLIPYINNARTHDNKQVDQIIASIKEFGFTNPVLIDETDNIIAGHGRLLAAKKMNLDEVPCIIIPGLTEAQKKAYIIADNKIALNSGWDEDLLRQEMESLRNLDFDLNIIGFDLNEIDQMINIFNEPIEDNYDLESVLNEINEPKSKIGDIYQLGNHRLMCGDSTNIKDVLELMNTEKADMVFTDPPWNVNYGSMEEGNPQGYKPRTILNDFMGTEQFKSFMFDTFNCMNKVSKEGCMTYVVMSAQEWGNMMLTLAENGYHWSSTIIWNKDHLVLSRKDYHTKYEPIWYGWKDGKSRLCPLKDRKQSDVWDFDRPIRSEEHPTMKPVALVAQAINNSSRSGNIILDLFGGSGTTLIACEQLNRSCYMMELDPKYVDVIIDRWERFTGKKAIKLEPINPQILDSLSNTYTPKQI